VDVHARLIKSPGRKQRVNLCLRPNPGSHLQLSPSHLAPVGHEEDLARPTWRLRLRPLLLLLLPPPLEIKPKPMATPNYLRAQMRRQR
jgi:hypothetical protein